MDDCKAIDGTNHTPRGEPSYVYHIVWMSAAVSHTVFTTTHSREGSDVGFPRC